MIDTILTASGVQYRKARFPKPPAGAYAVYFDDITTEGPDRIALPAAALLPRIYKHTATVELYAPDPETMAAAEASVEASIDAQGIPWTKQPCYWIQSEQLYQTIYELSYIEKRRN